MKVVLALLCLSLPLSDTLAQAATPSPTPINLTEYTAKLNEFSRVALAAVTDVSLDTYSLIQETEKSPVLVNAQFAKTQTLNILRELENFEQSSPRTSAKTATTKQIVAQSLGIMQRQASMPLGQQFSMPANDPFLLALDAEKTRLEKRMKAAEMRKTYSPVEVTVTQVLPEGCFVETNDMYGSKEFYLEGLRGADIAEDQRFKLPITRDGVYKYVDTNGASRTIEKYKIVKFDD